MSAHRLRHGAGGLRGASPARRVAPGGLMLALLGLIGCGSFDPPGFYRVLERETTYISRGDRDLGMSLFYPAPLAREADKLAGDADADHAQRALTDRPIVLMLHGGAFHFGHRELMRPLAEHLARLGFVTATADYRLASTDPFPAAAQDAVAAVRYLRTHGGEVGGDVSRIAALGVSAGANLAMIAAYCDDPDARLGDCGDPRVSPRVQAVVNVYGPADLALDFERASWWAKRLIRGYLHSDHPDADPALWRSASPIAMVSAGDPPTLTVHGRRDPIVGFRQALLLDEALRASGVPHTLVPVDAGHGWAYGSDRDSARLAALVSTWLVRTLEAVPGEPAAGPGLAGDAPNASPGRPAAAVRSGALAE